ncbi:60S ribosomal export protein NMD3 [Patescibacteria group bacterium]|nr:60S ribosomal export protein NMD3 [Candidatus Micrarchaeota archaeon]MBU1758356.1 60S ribosomal export protein NMD3 [Patescibacteria group bacterium]
MSGLICPKCGKKSEEIEFIEAFCIECYPVNIKLPGKLEIEQCRRCEKIKMRGEWTPYNKRKISEYVVSKCKGEFDAAEYEPENGVIRFIIEGKKEIKRRVDLEIKTVLCTYCSRVSGGYYKGIIQLRGNSKKIEKYADFFLEKLSKKTFITKAEEKHGGVDLYVGDSRAVVELVTALKLKTLMTKKLVGEEAGKRVYRTTFLIRF